MEKQVLLNSLQLTIVGLLARLFFRPTHPPQRLWIIGAIAFLLSNSLLTLPIHYPFFNFTGKGWNWSGKVYATLGSTLLYYVFRNDFRETDFVTLHQQPDSVHPNLVLMLGMLTVNSLSAWIATPQQVFNVETLAYQLTMPGMEEELLFRGILLSLLTAMYPKPIGVQHWTFGYPGIWLTAVLFGLVHGLRLEENWSPSMNWAYFGSTFLPGWLFGWMALKSRSILLPILTHNLFNFCLTFASMIK